MITRVYRVQIKAALREEFEPLFMTVAKGSVTAALGCTRVVVGGPTPLTPNEYAMITDWDNENSLTAFAGIDWSVAHIPEGMERFVETCWVHHFEHI